MESSTKCPPIKPILFPRDPASKSATQYRSSFEVKAFLLKYFPKYINELVIDLSEGPLNARLKRIKLVRNIFWDKSEKPHSNSWRLFAANKAKTVKCFKCRSDGRTFSNNFLQKLKLFPGQQELSLKALGENSSSELHYLKRTCSYLGILKNLHLLELFISHPRFLPILTKVNRNQRILNHLQTLSLVFTLTISQDHQFFQALLNDKNILRYLRYLSVHTLACKELFQIFQLVPKYCLQLQGLGLSTSPLEITCHEDDNYLECLQEFKTIKKLQIISYENLSFLQNAKLPTSLQSLRLEFQYIDWENNQDMTSFHDSLRNLTNLKTPDLLISRASIPEHQKYLQALIEGLLKNTPSLNRLSIILSRRAYLEPKSSADPILFDLSNLLACMSHMSDALEVLEIEDGLGFYDFIVGSSLPSFPKLKSLGLTVKISGFGRILGLARNVQLNEICVGSLKELLGEFLLMAKVKDIENKQAKITIAIANFKRDELDQVYFKENYEEVKKEIQGADLKNVNLKIVVGGKEEIFRKELETFREIFGEVNVEYENSFTYYDFLD